MVEGCPAKHNQRRLSTLVGARGPEAVQLHSPVRPHISPLHAHPPPPSPCPQTRGSKFTKYQELRVQELPEQVPVGAIPRSMLIIARGEATRTTIPGDIVDVAGADVGEYVRRRARQPDTQPRSIPPPPPPPFCAPAPRRRHLPADAVHGVPGDQGGADRGHVFGGAPGESCDRGTEWGDGSPTGVLRVVACYATRCGVRQRPPVTPNRTRSSTTTCRSPS